MLQRLLRRLLWVIPSALGVSILTFYVLSLVPADRVDERSPHARYRDLPLFFNPTPEDVRASLDRQVRALLTAPVGSDEATAAGAGLARIGGAALPALLPELDAYAPEERMRVALALAPIARRMQLDAADEAADPRLAVRYWTRFWEANEVEFRLATARNATRRWIVYGDRGREREVFRLDTFALEALFEVLPDRVEDGNLERTRRTVAALAHAVDSEDRIDADASVEAAEACAARWRTWWIAHRATFVRLRGTDRVAAIALETRYGKWAQEAVLGSNGSDHDRLWSRGRTTTALLGSAWLLSLVTALGIGTWSATRRDAAGGRALGGLAWLGFAMSPVVLATMAARALPSPSAATLAASLVLAIGLLARPLDLTRLRVSTELHGESARAALARGANRDRIAWTQGLRRAAPAVLSATLLELPLAVTGCFVVEHAFGIDGMGALTLAAVTSADVSRVMGLAVGATCWAVIAMTLGDLVLALAEPRTRTALLRHGRRA